MTLQGDINMLPAGSFRWFCGEGFLDNVSDRGEQRLKAGKSPKGGIELGGKRSTAGHQGMYTYNYPTNPEYQNINPRAQPCSHIPILTITPLIK